MSTSEERGTNEQPATPARGLTLDDVSKIVGRAQKLLSGADPPVPFGKLREALWRISGASNDTEALQRALKAFDSVAQPLTVERLLKVLTASFNLKSAAFLGKSPRDFASENLTPDQQQLVRSYLAAPVSSESPTRAEGTLLPGLVDAPELGKFATVEFPRPPDASSPVGSAPVSGPERCRFWFSVVPPNELSPGSIKAARLCANPVVWALARFPEELEQLRLSKDWGQLRDRTASLLRICPLASLRALPAAFYSLAVTELGEEAPDTETWLEVTNSLAKAVAELGERTSPAVHTASRETVGSEADSPNASPEGRQEPLQLTDRLIGLADAARRLAAPVSAEAPVRRESAHDEPAATEPSPTQASDEGETRDAPEHARHAAARRSCPEGSVIETVLQLTSWDEDARPASDAVGLLSTSEDIEHLGLRVGWRAVRRALQRHEVNYELELRDLVVRHLKPLIARTQEVCHRFLVKGVVNVEGEDGGDDAELLAIDSDYLHVYLLSRLLGSERLQAYFFELNDGPDDRKSSASKQDPVVHRLRRWAVSRDEQLRFVDTLSVLALRVIHTMTTRRHPRFEWPFKEATPLELTQAIVHLIDRFAVIDFGLDNRFRVEEQLSRAYAIDAVLYLTKAHYREHVFHVLDVFLLGLLLLDSELEHKPGETGPQTFVDWVRERVWQPLSRREGLQRTLQNWALAALFHDVGYALDTVKAVAPLLSRVHSRPAAAYERAVSAGAEKGTRAFYEEFLAWKPPCGRSPLAQAGHTLPDIAQRPFERTNHGITSYCHLLQALVEVDARRGPLATEGGPAATTEMVDGFVPALRAIYFHDLHDQGLDISQDPLAVLLALVDELQDWSRSRMRSEDTAQGLGASWKLSLQTPNPTGALVSFVLTNLAEANNSPRIDRASSAWATPTPRFRIPLAGPAFFLLFRDPSQALYQAVGTLLAKASNLQRLRLTGCPWGYDEGQGHRQNPLLVSCLFPVPESSTYGLRELEVYRTVALEERGLPYPEAVDRRFVTAAMRGEAKDYPLFGYAKLDGRERLFLPPPAFSEELDTIARTPLDVFTLEVTQLARQAWPEAGQPHALFPTSPRGSYFAAVDRVRARLINRYRLAHRRRRASMSR